MLIYLNQAPDERRARRAAEGGVLTRADLYDAIMEGAVERVRPKMMTVVAIMAGLLPIMWSTGTGSEIMQRIAVPMIGGMIVWEARTMQVADRRRRQLSPLNVSDQRRSHKGAAPWQFAQTSGSGPDTRPAILDFFRRIGCRL